MAQSCSIAQFSCAGYVSCGFAELLWRMGVSCRLLSRSDIFKPLFKEDYEEFLEKERVSSAGVLAVWKPALCRH